MQSTTVDILNLDVYVINLDQSRHRWINCFRNLSAFFPANKIRRVPAINGTKMSEKSTPDGWSELAKQRLQTEGYLGVRPVPDPIRTAVCLSHQRALECFLDLDTEGVASADWALIVEDDVQPAHALLATVANRVVIQIPNSADIVFLHDRVGSVASVVAHNSPETENCEHADVALRGVTGGIGLEAYLVSRTGAQKMLESWRPLYWECDIQLMCFAEYFQDLTLLRQMENLMGHSLRKLSCFTLKRPLFQIDQELQSDKVRLIEETTPKSTLSGIHQQFLGATANQLVMDHQSPIAFATCWFNPAHFRSRVDNYLRFYEGVSNCNVVTVELAFGEDDWQLPDATPNLLRLRSDTVCWQKEALLNYGLARLDELDFPYVGWLDADIKFSDPSWQDSLLEGLRTKRLCQAFESVETSFPDQGRRRSFGAAAAWVAHGKSPIQCGVTGFGWAMHKEVWRQAKLYDYNIIGGGDHVMWRSVFANALDRGVLFGDRAYTSGMKSCRDQWAEKWAETVMLSVGFARGIKVRSLPHGDLNDRGYGSRWDKLEKLQFDPLVHVARDSKGLLTWTNLMKVEARQYVAEYFRNRREDGSLTL